jgi:broad specificity phosphatase PhoE
VDRSWYFPDSRNGLTDLGKRQAVSVATRLVETLRGKDVSLHSSDMTRARETAQIVGEALGLTPELDARLREWSEPRALERTEAATWDSPDDGESLFDWRPYPEHETWREFHARVGAFMTEWGEGAPDDGTAVFVVHGGTLSNLVVCWLGIPLDVLPDRTCFSATPGSLSVLRYNRYGKPVVGCLNDRRHLAPTPQA